jgi:3'(2'), 5'-bisphosphate nucleotidase
MGGTKDMTSAAPAAPAAERRPPIDRVDLPAYLAGAAVTALQGVRESELLEGGALGDAGDSIANHLLIDLITRLAPGDAILSEESADDLARLDAERIWIIDPLDGTRQFSEGCDEWAVHVALVEDGVPVAAAVGLRDRVVSTGTPPAPPPDHGRTPRIAVSRNRPAAEAVHVAGVLGAELVPLGSAGFKAMAVLRGEVDAYVHSGGQFQWDSAAPVGVALAAGLHCSRLDGSPLVYNRRDVSLPDLVICRRELAAPILKAVHP